MNVKFMMLMLLPLLAVSCNQPLEKKAASLQQEFVVELAPFTLKEGITESKLLEASRAVQENFVEQQPGFIKRELVRKSGKAYLELVYWESQEHAEQAAQKAMNSPVCLDFFSLMEESEATEAGGGITYYKHVSTYR